MSIRKLAVVGSLMRNILGSMLVAGVLISLSGCRPEGGAATEEPAISKDSQALSGLLLLPLGSDWRYLDTGVDPGAGWNQPGWDDSTWKSGPAEFGYGDSDEATVVSYGSSSSRKYTTTYFRSTFEVADPAQLYGLHLSLIRDDGIVLYVNGTEIFRDNLPTSAISFSTRALRDVGAPEESSPVEIDVDGATVRNLLSSGTNVIAAEVHQASASSSDLSFDLQVQATPLRVVRGPYLQNGTPESAVISFRTSAPSSGRVRWGRRPDRLTEQVVDIAPVLDHELTISGLEPNQSYYYAVGTDSVLLEGGDWDQYFVTPALPGSPEPTRIWVVGDPSTGWGGPDPKAVRDAYTRTLGAQSHTDILLLPGDQAYNSGLDYSYTPQIFDMYRDYLRTTFSWATLGNHDTNQSTDLGAILNSPFFKIFALPTAGQGGGVPSGSERYYSFDHGNIHFVGLDTQTLENALIPQPMLDWLDADLAANTRDWVIAFLHKSPYSKGQHSSDTSADSVQVRKQIVPVLERYGVDLVLSGHDHVYERSHLIYGHYGLSSEFGDGSQFIVQPGDGRISGGGAYVKPSRDAGPEANRGTVYVVSGSAGGLGGGSLDHPAMLKGLNVLGSTVIDVDGGRLDLRFLRETGAIDDEFTILRGPQLNTPPTVSIALSGTSSAAPANGLITASASDADGRVREVSFYLNGELLSVDSSEPFQADFAAVSSGTYQLYAVARDDQGGTAMSLPATFEVIAPPPLLTATAGPSSVALSWNRSFSGDTKYRIDRAQDAGEYQHIGTVWASRFTSYIDPSLEPNHTYKYRVRAIRPSGEQISNQVSATPTAGAPEVIVSAGARWKYLDNGSNQGTDWQSPTFDDTAWSSGVSHLGYGDAGTGPDLEEETVISYGPDSKAKYITYYFRKSFFVSDAASYAASGVKLGQRVNRDDGAVIYLNGTEIARTNLPTGTVNYLTRASSAVEDQWWTKNDITSNLVDGWNVIAAEVHQSDPGSSDISFDLELRKATPEICDGYDNDVDGSSDEDFPKGASCAAGTGECQQMGVGACASDGSSSCTNLTTNFPRDRTAPVIRSIVASPSVIRQKNNKLVPVHLTADADDNCGAIPSCYVFSVSSNEPCEDRGPRKLCPAWRVTADMDVDLRAQRDGEGTGRVYTINVVCRDARGNSSRISTEVKVPH